MIRDGEEFAVRIDEVAVGDKLRVRPGEKIAVDGPRLGNQGLVTTIYLSEAEYVVLAQLPGMWLTKTRYSFPPMGVDVFQGRLEPLMIAVLGRGR